MDNFDDFVDPSGSNEPSIIEMMCIVMSRNTKKKPALEGETEKTHWICDHGETIPLGSLCMCVKGHPKAYKSERSFE